MRTKRIFSIIIDLFITMFIGLGIFAMIIEIFNITNRLFYNVFQFILMTIIISIKDLPFKNGSLGKKICQLEILTTNNENPTNLVKILRNLTVYIWPIELVLLIVFNKRLGDILFKTKVIEVQKN